MTTRILVVDFLSRRLLPAQVPCASLIACMPALSPHAGVGCRPLTAVSRCQYSRADLALEIS